MYGKTHLLAYKICQLKIALFSDEEIAEQYGIPRCTVKALFKDFIEWYTYDAIHL